jgi:hypothetical protein
MVKSNQKYHSPKESSKVFSTSSNYSIDFTITTKKKIFREILATEENYVKNLSLLRDLCVIPLTELVGTPKQILSAEEISIIFSNLDQLLTLNKRSSAQKLFFF